MIALLDGGLRRGEPGRLEAEYPVSLTARDLRGHRVVFAEGRPVAHAMLHAIELRSGQRSARLGLIGNVYTAPEFRGRGHAARCVEACVALASARGCALALLWSERADYYAALGFRPGGSERRIQLDGDTLARAASPVHDCAIDVAHPADFSALEALYAQKPVHVVRAPGALAKLASAPELALLVARRAGRPIAYAACGRGDDLRSVIHEWAGDADGVLGCVAALHEIARASLLLASPHAEPAAERLIAAGARVTETPLGLLRELDPSACRASALESWIYLWGFDSI